MMNLSAKRSLRWLGLGLMVAFMGLMLWSRTEAFAGDPCHSGCPPPPPQPPPPSFSVVLIIVNLTYCGSQQPAAGLPVALTSLHNPNFHAQGTTDTGGQYAAWIFLFGSNPGAALGDLQIAIPGYEIGELSSFILSFPFVGTFAIYSACVYPHEKPDLMPTWTKLQSLEDDTANLEVRVTNQGKARAGESKLDIKVDGQSVLEEGFSIRALDPGEFQTIELVKHPLAPGLHDLYAEADFKKGVDESNEDNNVAKAQVDNRRPDLTVKWDNMQAFNDYTLNATIIVANIGTGDAGATKLIITERESGRQLKSFDVPALRAGGGKDFSLQLTLGPGKHTLDADVKQVAKEVKVVNNRAPLALAPNLKIDRTKIVVQPNSGTKGCSGSFTVVNEGNWPGSGIVTVTLVGPDLKPRSGSFGAGTGVVDSNNGGAGPFRFWVLGENSYFPPTPVFNGNWQVTIKLEGSGVANPPDQSSSTVTTPMCVATPWT